jgi:hypothetical protein
VPGRAYISCDIVSNEVNLSTRGNLPAQLFEFLERFTMTPKELAQQIHGQEYGRRAQLTPEEAKAAKGSGIVVVYGASDDLVEIEGAIQDEFGTNTLYFTKAGLLTNECDNEDCPHFERLKKVAAPLDPVWCDDPHLPSWTFRTAIPHETFDIMEDGFVFCRGIVFALADVPL